MKLRAAFTSTMAVLEVALLGAWPASAFEVAPNGDAVFVMLPVEKVTSATVATRMPNGVPIPITVQNPATGLLIPPGLAPEPASVTSSAGQSAGAAANALTVASASLRLGNVASGTIGLIARSATKSDAVELTSPLSLNSAAAQGVNNVTQETLAGTTGANWLGIYDGTAAAPSTTTNPPFFAQRHVLRDLGSEFAQTVGGQFVDITTHGSGQKKPLRGAVMAGLFSNTCVGVNQGSTFSPNFDLNGDCIGLAGFAASNGALYNGHITTGVWGWAMGPTIDAATYANLPAYNWTTAGVEINVSYNHPDPGVQSALIGKGSTVGLLINNYRKVGAGIADLTFGLDFSGVPNDGDYSSTDISNYSGFHTAALFDKIKNFGLRFGPLAAKGSQLVAFPTSFAGTQEPACGVCLGGAKINVGTYNGFNFNEGDLWHNGDRIYYAHTAGKTTVNEKLLTDRAGVTMLSATHKFSLNGGYGLGLSTAANAVNYTFLYNAATGGSPALVATGADTNIGLELSAKGTGTLMLNGAVKALSTIAIAGHTLATGPVPSLSFCGISPTISGADNAGLITTGTGATSCSLKFSQPYASRPYCTVTGENTAVTYIVTKTAIIITAGAGANVDYQCTGQSGG